MRFLNHRKERALALILPHAGYVYSGKTTGMTVNRAEVPQGPFLLCPNHRGIGVNCALSGFWRIPTATIPRAADLCAAIINHAHGTKKIAEHMKKTQLFQILLPSLHAHCQLHPCVPIFTCHLLSFPTLRVCRTGAISGRAIPAGCSCPCGPMLPQTYTAARAQGGSVGLRAVLAMDTGGFSSF